MRALLRGERVASPLMMGALVGMSAIAIAALFLAVGYRSQFVNLKHVIYSRCQARDAYDAASQKARAAQRQWFVQQISTEQTDPFIDPRLRTERVTAAQQAIAGLDTALAVGVPRGCSAYK